MTLEIDGIKIELSAGDTFEYLGDKKFKVSKTSLVTNYLSSSTFQPVWSYNIQAAGNICESFGNSQQEQN